MLGIFGQRSHFPAAHTGEPSINLCVISFPQKTQFHYTNTNKGIKGPSWRDTTEHRTHMLTRTRHLRLLGSAGDVVGSPRHRGTGGAPKQRDPDAHPVRQKALHKTEGLTPEAAKSRGKDPPRSGSWKEVALDYSVTFREDPKKTQERQWQKPSVTQLSSQGAEGYEGSTSTSL